MANKKTGRPGGSPGAKKPGGIGILILCLLLITAAVFGGFALANSIRGGNSSGSGNTGNSPANPGSTADNYANSGKTAKALLSTPIEVIYDVDFNTGRIEEILIGILKTASGRLDYIRIDAGVMYTMSSTLYSALTPENTTLPQTVTFSELYRYYGNNKAFEAGRRIISELLSISVDYYCALPDENFDRLFSVRQIDGETYVRTASDISHMKEDYGTGGSLKGFIEKVFDGAVTDLDIDQRLRYLETLDSLEDKDVSFTLAPVLEKNESRWLDTGATAGILYELLY